MLYKSIIFLSRSPERGGLITRTSQLISSVVSHLNVDIPRSGWRTGYWRGFNFFGHH